MRVYDALATPGAGVAVPSDVSATVVMRPGDAMFIPAGLHHILNSAVWFLIGDYTVEQPVVDLTDELTSVGGGLLRHFTVTFDQAVATFAEAYGEEAAAEVDPAKPPPAVGTKEWAKQDAARRKREVEEARRTEARQAARQGRACRKGG